MRKFISLMLTLTFLLSTLAFAAVSVGAETASSTVGSVAAGYTPKEGATAITGDSDFEAMKADGDYYLSGDITLTKTYASKFTGTFDGCGHKITISAPLFADMSGEFKNVVIEGTASGANTTDNHVGAVSANTTGTARLENVCNKATITGVGSGTTAGLIGRAADKSVVTLENCVNNGVVKSAGGQSGGLVGYSQGKTLTVKNCLNTAAVDAGTSYGGGIVGRFGKDKSTADYLCTIENCVNNGSVKGGKDQSGGIIGYLVAVGEISDCVNTGDVTSPIAAGGILGQSVSSKKGETRVSALTIENCINSGKISGTTRVGGIAGGFGRFAPIDGKGYNCKNCVNFGEVVCDAKVLSDDGGGAYAAGGILGYAWGGSKGANGAQNCINFGKVNVSTTLAATAQSYPINVGGIIGYFSSSGYVFKNNASVGEVTATGFATDAARVAALFYNNHATGDGKTYVEGNMSFGNTALKSWFNATVELTAPTALDQTKDIASGKLAYEFNQRVGADMLFQKLGTDALPTYQKAADGSNTLLKEGDDIKNNTPPEETDPGTTPSTGDATGVMFVLLAVCAVSAFALALIPSKKRQK